MSKLDSFLPEGGCIPPLDYAAELNAEQKAAATAPEGPALVIAGAGSGKTRTLTYRVAWLLEQGVRPWEILLLTFTNKAAREMLQRVEDLTGVPGQKFWGGTFHSIGQRLLRRYGAVLELDASFNIMDQGDSESLLADVIRGIDPGFTKSKEHPKPRVVHEMISYARNTERELEDVVQERYPWLEQLAGQIRQFADAYRDRKRRSQLCDYDDLLELWLRLLTDDAHAEVREVLQTRYRHILVDEYQDTNLVQARIVNLMAQQHRNIMVVGDNWQCIYTWRGAEFGNMADFSAAYPERNIYKIETNYRSTPQILSLANALMAHHPSIDGYPLELQAHRPGRERPWVVPQLDTRQQAWWILRRVEGLLDEGRSMKDIAVLYRAHYQAMDLQMELSRAGVPYTITSGVRFFEQAHIRDFCAQLRFVSNPYDAPAFQRMVGLLPKVGPRTADRLHTLLQTTAEKHHLSFPQAMTHETVLAKVPKPAKDDWNDLGLTLQNLEDAMGGPSVKPGKAPAQDDLFAPTPSSPVKSAPATPEEVVTLAIDGWYGDYLRNVYDNWQSRRDDLDSLKGFASRFDSLTEMLSQLVLLNSETSDRKIDPDSDTLKLTTVHQAKGLEFPVVFIVGLADNLFPLKRAIEEGDLDEERRLFYVAVTRAKEELYLMYPRIAGGGGPPQLLEPSRFLKDLPESSYEILR